MNTTLLITSVIAGAAFLSGCNPSSTDKTALATSSVATQEVNKAQAAANETAQEIKEYAYEQKAEFVASMQTKLTAMNREFDELSKKIENSSDAVKADAKPKLAALSEQSKLLGKQLEAIKDSAPTTWANTRSDAQKGYESLKAKLNQSRQWLSDKIAP